MVVHVSAIVRVYTGLVIFLKALFIIIGFLKRIMMQDSGYRDKKQIKIRRYLTKGSRKKKVFF